MSLQGILEDWSEYDNRKIRDKRDGRFFSCEEIWERQYLIDKIRIHHPSISVPEINEAINSCCKVIHAPRPRKEFVECVYRRLGLS